MTIGLLRKKKMSLDPSKHYPHQHSSWNSLLNLSWEVLSCRSIVPNPLWELRSSRPLLKLSNCYALDIHIFSSRSANDPFLTGTCWAPAWTRTWTTAAATTWSRAGTSPQSSTGPGRTRPPPTKVRKTLAFTYCTVVKYFEPCYT